MAKRRSRDKRLENRSSESSRPKNGRAKRRSREAARRLERQQNLRKVAIAVVVIAIVAVVAMIALNGDNAGPEPSEGIQVNERGELVIASTDVTKDARYYSFDASGVDVRFFAVRGSDGDVRVAMDACDVCYDAKRGYRQDGNDMVCNNCGNEYSTDGIGTENLRGGCWPSYVPIKEEGGNILIKASDLKAKRYMFD